MKIPSHSISILAAAITAIASVLLPVSTSAADNPNVVIILVDDMGYGDAGCYNPESKIPTPAIDSLARDGMRFTDAHSSGALCHVSRYGLMTGQYPFRANPGAWRTRATIAPDQLTVAGLLKKAHYSTAMVGKWHLGFDEKTYDDPLPGGPADRGFDSYFGIRASTDIPPYFYIRDRKAVMPPSDRIEANDSEGWSPIQGAFWREGGIAPNLKLKDVLPLFFREAEGVIDRHAAASSDNPLFLYLALPAPHTPWLPSDEFVGTSKASMYGDFMVMVDSLIGDLLANLNKNKMSEDTLVIFSSDNGPVWYQEDIERFGHDSTGGFRGMKADAWEGGHRMPFIVRWPGQVEAGSVCDQTVSFVDVMATLADVAGVELGDRDAPDSQSFYPLLTQSWKSNSPFRTPLVIQSGSGFMSIRDGDWKLITGLGSGGFSRPRRIVPSEGGPQGQLYHMKNDPFETNNLYLEQPERVAHLTKSIEKITSASKTRVSK